MTTDRKFLVFALGYAAVGMALGIYMAASRDHGQLVTHAHILLVGFVASLVYGIIHKLWLQRPAPMLARVQFWLHQLGTACMVAGLFLLYGGFAPERTLGPLLGLGSAAVLAGVLVMLYMVARPAAGPVAAG